jgi:branched-chain amino acid transport system ATP-binding protein
MSEPLLDLRAVTVQFGGLKAVTDFNFSINHGELTGLIGPNGAGKTTIFNLITGVYRPTSGTILFEGKSVAGKKPYLITKRGIARTFQNIRLFSSMSVFDNVRAAFNMHLRHGISHALWRGRGLAAEEARVEKEARELLDIFHLENICDSACTSLSYGDQRRLEIVRALATHPKLILLDEPAAGMNPTEKTELMELIRFVQEKFKIAVLLVEHDMRVVMGICERIAVLDYGIKIAEGSAPEIKCNPAVIRAYLGVEEEEPQTS